MLKEVCIQGLGFVGMATATVIASARDKDNRLLYNVTGIELNNKKGLEKIQYINKGKLDFSCEDNIFKEKLKEAVLKNKNLKATIDENSYCVAEVVVIATNLDIKKIDDNLFDSKVIFGNFKKGLLTIGKRIKPDCLIIIETTIPPGTSEKIVEKVISKEFLKRNINKKPLICHSYERVTPGKNYLKSITDTWRSFSVNCNNARNKAETFLSSIINVQDHPLIYFDNTNSTEIAKILENSYRAVNIAFIYEWTLLAEELGVNLFEIIEAIKKRKGTHDNIMKPGFGVGGYCLPKDALLAQWALKNLFQINDLKLDFSLRAIEINDKMPLHVYNLIIEQLGSIISKKVLICGASYLPDVFDLRNTPTKILYDKIKQERGICHITDIYLEKQTPIFEDKDILRKTDMKSYDVIIYAVRYEHYLNLDPNALIKNIKKDVLLVDAFDIFNDEKIKIFLKNKINIIGVGKGHIKHLKNDLK